MDVIVGVVTPLNNACSPLRLRYRSFTIASDVGQRSGVAKVTDFTETPYCVTVRTGFSRTTAFFNACARLLRRSWRALWLRNEERGRAELRYSLSRNHSSAYVGCISGRGRTPHRTAEENVGHFLHVR